MRAGIKKKSDQTTSHRMMARWKAGKVFHMLPLPSETCDSRHQGKLFRFNTCNPRPPLTRTCVTDPLTSSLQRYKTLPSMPWYVLGSRNTLPTAADVPLENLQRCVQFTRSPANIVGARAGPGQEDCVSHRLEHMTNRISLSDFERVYSSSFGCGSLSLLKREISYPSWCKLQDRRKFLGISNANPVSCLAIHMVEACSSQQRQTTTFRTGCPKTKASSL